MPPATASLAQRSNDQKGHSDSAAETINSQLVAPAHGLAVLLTRQS